MQDGDDLYHDSRNIVVASFRDGTAVERLDKHMQHSRAGKNTLNGPTEITWW